MTNITKHGDEATVSSMVLDYAEFENTLNNIKKFVGGLSIQKIDKIFTNPQEFKKIPEYSALFNILNGEDFQEIGLTELSDFAQLIKVVGLDKYALYTVPEYAYMYTRLVEYFDEY